MKENDYIPSSIPNNKQRKNEKKMQLYHQNNTFSSSINQKLISADNITKKKKTQKKAFYASRYKYSTASIRHSYKNNLNLSLLYLLDLTTELQEVKGSLKHVKQYYGNKIRKMQSMESLWGKQPGSPIIFKVEKKKKKQKRSPDKNRLT